MSSLPDSIRHPARSRRPCAGDETRHPDQRGGTSPPQRVPRTPDEWISFGRLLLAGVLWIPAILRKPRLVAAGIVLSAISDIADGFVSRLLGSRSDYSRQLDSVADSAVMLSSIGWLGLARPGSLRPLRATLAAIGVIAALLLSVQWKRYGRFGALHIDSARAAAVVGHIYALLVLWRGSAPSQLLRLFQLLVAGAAIESAWVILGGYDPSDRTTVPLLTALSKKCGAESQRDRVSQQHSHPLRSPLLPFRFSSVIALPRIGAHLGDKES